MIFSDQVLRLGRYVEAERLVSVAERTAPADDVRAQARWRRARARLQVAAGATDRAVVLASEEVSLIARCEAPNLHADALVDLAEVLRAAGREGDAVAALGEAVRRYGSKGNVVCARAAADLLAAAQENVRTGSARDGARSPA